MRADWPAALDELNGDPEVGAIVMTGAGRAFSAGADVARFEAARDARDRGEATLPREQRPLPDWISHVRASKPIVVAVNGAAIGAGLTRILPCDVRIASEQARFSMRFVKVGLTPEIGSTQILPQVVGLQHALDLILSGRTIDARTALAIGLVLKVVEPERLLDEAIALAAEYAESGPQALRASKDLVYRWYVEQDMAKVVADEGKVIAGLLGGPENREAIMAFREKRAPDFRKLAR
jgi:2-(1,2-epoxy-1,2-dihydrophenyl)acetyl-CoA isomerase